MASPKETQNPKERGGSFRYHLVAMARDIVVLAAGVSLIGTSTKWVWEPYLNFPQEMREEVRQIREELADMKASMSSRVEPLLIDFQGIGQIVGPTRVPPGGSITIIYSLRRNASCETRVEPIFYNVDRGSSVLGKAFNAIKSPVSRDYGIFKLDIPVPHHLRPGTYVYQPKLTPVDCHIYKEQLAVPSTTFEVVP